MTNWHYNKSFNNGFHEVFSIQGVERGMYRHGGVTAPAESLWLERV